MGAIKKKLDREFFDALGEEMPGEPCRSEGYGRGAIQQSVFCRVHHYEMIKSGMSGGPAMAEPRIRIPVKGR